jgi:multidrug efflux pump subunit AcrA (membrane-fusion protein)
MAARLDIEGEHAAIKSSVAGQVSFVYPEVDPITRMFRVKIAVPPDPARVQPGLFAKATVDLNRRPR